MNPLRSRTGCFARKFRDRYLESLHDYRFFYDDVTTVGDPATAEHVFYFVPGINGTPGQMRFVLPSLTRVFGSRIYFQALHLPEFSAQRPTWEKYTIVNVERKLDQLRADLAALLARHEHVTVIASSNGFYDFAAASAALAPETLRDRVHLIWGACAPDHFEPTPWEKVFFPLTGFEHDGYRWFAYPNQNALKIFNPETSNSHLWRDGSQHRRFRKTDLESRFNFLGLEWDYISPGQLAAAAAHVVRQIPGPLACPSHSLVAANDGYWAGKSHEFIERTIRKYLPETHVAFRPASHLWVVTPSYVTELFRDVKRGATTRRLAAEPALRSGALPATEWAQPAARTTDDFEWPAGPDSSP
jgi:hypothetical protein